MKHARGRCGGPRRRRLVVERLETRCLLAAEFVNADESGAIVDNSIVLSRSGGQIQVAVDGATVLNQAADSLTTLTINGQFGVDTLTVDFSGGNPIPAGGLVFHGGDPTDGSPGDMLVLDPGTSNSMFGSISHTLVTSSDGSIRLNPDGPSGSPQRVITYTGLEPISDHLDTVDRVFSFAGAAETVTLTDVGGADGQTQIDSTLGESVTFANPTGSLTIDAATGTGSDAVHVEGVDAAFDADLFVLGDGDDTVRFQTSPTAIGSGEIDVTAGEIRFTATLSTTGAARLEAISGAILGNPDTTERDLIAAVAELSAGTGIDLDLQVSSVEADSGSGILFLDNAGALTIGAVSADFSGVVAGDEISIIALGDLTVAEPVTETAGTTYIELDGYTVRINADIATGGSLLDIWSRELGDIILNATIDTDGGELYVNGDNDVTINGSILTQGEYAELYSSGKITFTAAGRMDAEVSPEPGWPRFELDGSTISMADGSIVNARDGQIGVFADGDIAISSLVAGDWGVEVFAGDGTILDGGDLDPDIVSGVAYLAASRAGDVGTADNPLDTVLDFLGGKSANGFYVANAGPLEIVYSGIIANGDVQIETGGALSLWDPVVTSGTVALTAAGAIIDTNGDARNIAAPRVALTAAGGIGSGDPIETQITDLAYHNAASGDVEITNTGALRVNGVGSLTSSANAGNTILIASSPITFAADSTQASLLATADDDGLADADNIVFETGVTTSATAGDVVLQAGDRVLLAATATIQATGGSGNVIIESGYADTDDDGSMSLDGAIVAVGTVTLDLNAESGFASQAGTGSITAAALQMRSTASGGSFALDSTATNNVVTLAAAADGSVAYRDLDDVAVGTVATAGVTTTGDAVTILAPRGTITIDGSVTTTPGESAEVITVGSVIVNSSLTPGAGTITLYGETFAVSSLTPALQGFTVQFNRDVKLAPLNLYDQGGVLGLADVVVIGPDDTAVRGSLLFDSGLRTVTFTKSDGLLEPGVYSVTLRSGDTAFQDTLGNALDGDGDGVPGGDYAADFSVLPPTPDTVVISLPDFTRGFGQPVNVPADVFAAGLPLTLSNGLGVSRVKLQLSYDATLLDVSAFRLEPTLLGRGGTAVFTREATGRITLDITSPVSLATAEGPLTLGAFSAEVPEDAPYGGKHVLDLSELQVWDNAATPALVPAMDDDALHLAAFLGDNNGDGTYNSPDTMLARRIIGQINTGLSAYQRVDPAMSADISLNGSLESNDTTMIRQAIGQLAVPNLPPLPTGITPPAASGADPLVSIPRDLTGAPGDTVDVPVVIEITEPEGLSIGGFDIVIAFDAERFTITEAKLGALLQATDVVGTLSQPEVGKLIFSADSLLGTSHISTGTVGDLMVLTVAIAADASTGPAPFNLLASLGPTRTGVYDAALNTLALQPEPANAADDAVDGVLTILDPTQPQQNPSNPLDVNGDGIATPRDALLLINHLNGLVPGSAPPPGVSPATFYGDVNGDGNCAADDVLVVVNALNGFPPGPLGVSPAESEPTVPLAALHVVHGRDNRLLKYHDRLFAETADPLSDDAFDVDWWFGR